jgi:hypothetical protein
MTEELNGEAIDVTTVEQAAQLMEHWLSQVKQTLDHMRNIPEGTVVEHGGTENEVTLSGDVLTAFKTGIDIAVALLEESPFTVTQETEEVSTNEPVQS